MQVPIELDAGLWSRRAIEMASIERYRNDRNGHQREPMEALTPLSASSWRAFDNAAGLSCITPGAPYFAITDGQRWEIYETFKPLPAEEKR